MMNKEKLRQLFTIAIPLLFLAGVCFIRASRNHDIEWLLIGFMCLSSAMLWMDR
jgi:hypothetical protein